MEIYLVLQLGSSIIVRAAVLSHLMFTMTSGGDGLMNQKSEVSCCLERGAKSIKL